MLRKRTRFRAYRHYECANGWRWRAWPLRDPRHAYGDDPAGESALRATSPDRLIPVPGTRRSALPPGRPHGAGLTARLRRSGSPPDWSASADHPSGAFADASPKLSLRRLLLPQAATKPNAPSAASDSQTVLATQAAASSGVPNAINPTVMSLRTGTKSCASESAHRSVSLIALAARRCGRLLYEGTATNPRG